MTADDPLDLEDDLQDVASMLRRERATTTPRMRRALDEWLAEQPRPRSRPGHLWRWTALAAGGGLLCLAAGLASALGVGPLAG